MICITSGTAINSSTIICVAYCLSCIMGEPEDAEVDSAGFRDPGTRSVPQTPPGVHISCCLLHLKALL